MIDRALGVAGLGVGVIGLVLITVFPMINRYVAWAGLMLGVLLIAGAVVIAFLPDSAPQTPPAGAAQGRCNAIGNGNSVCNNND